MSENETPSVPDAVLAPLREVLSHFPYVGLAVLFGSVAAGRARADSDLDVAVSAGRSLTAPEMLHMTQALAEKTGRPVDLIDLASVSAPLLGQIVFMPLRNQVLAQRRMAWIGK
ncbi:MAG: nucleotidyltransferase domain-containing protein [Simplicispira sp.]|nr:nucleotidyltransferase domain-containing protein [Simplicispira sp.]